MFEYILLSGGVYFWVIRHTVKFTWGLYGFCCLQMVRVRRKPVLEDSRITLDRYPFQLTFLDLRMGNNCKNGIDQCFETAVSWSEWSKTTRIYGSAHVVSVLIAYAQKSRFYMVTRRRHAHDAILFYFSLPYFVHVWRDCVYAQARLHFRC